VIVKQKIYKRSTNYYFDMIDTDKDGKITKYEFTAATQAHPGTNGDGKLTRAHTYILHVHIHIICI
jgi:hypothetical protein